MLGICIVFLMFLMATPNFNWILIVVVLILGACMVTFATLKVTIEADALKIRFGSGIIRKKFLLKDIQSYKIVKNPWYYGWGIHLTPHGWLYNVSGSYAVEISMKSGKKYLIGTDVPNELEKAIEQAIERV